MGPSPLSLLGAGVLLAVMVCGLTSLGGHTSPAKFRGQHWSAPSFRPPFIRPMFLGLRGPSHGNLPPRQSYRRFEPPTSHGCDHRWLIRRVHKARVVYDSKWLQVEEHLVLGEDNVTARPWVWANYPDQVNILPEVGGEYWVFRQRKYGLEGESLAVVGGLIEPGETPETAARRELREEMRLETPDLVFLGRFRTDANRGMGWCSTFLARRCVPAAAAPRSDDVERQTLRRLSRRDLCRALLRGAFAEVKWANTVALSLLALDP